MPGGPGGPCWPGGPGNPSFPSRPGGPGLPGGPGGPGSPSRPPLPCREQIRNMFFCSKNNLHQALQEVQDVHDRRHDQTGLDHLSCQAVRAIRAFHRCHDRPYSRAGQRCQAVRRVPTVGDCISSFPNVIRLLLVRVLYRMGRKLTCTIICCFGKTRTKPKKYFVLE